MHFNVVLTQALRVFGDDDLAVGATAIEKAAEFFYDEMELPKTLPIEKILTDCKEYRFHEDHHRL